jgi:glutamine phosphoribosylpyrophosphate amidotransferase
MLRHLIAVLAGSLLLVLQLPATPPPSAKSAANLSSAQEMNFTLEGKISDLTASKMTVSTEENIIFHVRYDEKTEIRKTDGSPATAKDLHVGLRVGVEGNLTESGEIIAKSIEIQTEASKKQ